MSKASKKIKFPYAKGVRLERKVMRFLKEIKGWPLVVRSAGSHGPVDLVAISPLRIVWLIQVKSKKRIPQHTVEELRKIAPAEMSWLLPVFCWAEKGELHLKNIHNLKDIRGVLDDNKI